MKCLSAAALLCVILSLYLAHVGSLFLRLRAVSCCRMSALLHNLLRILCYWVVANNIVCAAFVASVSAATQLANDMDGCGWVWFAAEGGYGTTT